MEKKLLNDEPADVLRGYLRATERESGPDSDAARQLRRMLETRLAKDAETKNELARVAEKKRSSNRGQETR